MRFERLLAKRYIFEQKRHSLLTICSIIIAIGLMTSLLLSFDTLFKCLRNAEYSKNPYHLLIRDVTEDQASSIYNDPIVKDVKLKMDPNTHKKNAQIILKEDIGDEFQFLEEFNKKHNLGLKNDSVFSPDKHELNLTLMMFDGIGDKAMMSRNMIYCLFFIFVIFIVLALRLIIDTAFEVSSKERERQFGVLQSIGATPKQTVNIITFEGAMLCIAGIPIGLLLGIAVAFLAYKSILSTGVADDYLMSNSKAADIIHFSVSPLMLIASAVIGIVWVLFSAYGTGMRIIKMSPVEAINNRSSKVKKVSKHSLYGLLFGWTGKLASRNAHRQRKRFIITVLSLTISITLFASMSVVMDAIDEYVMNIFISDEFGDVNTDLVVDLIQDNENGIEKYKKAYDQLMNCGYFSDLTVYNYAFGNCKDKNGESQQVEVIYCNKSKYNLIFDNKPPISYDELNDKGYLLLNRTGNEKYEYFHEPDSVNQLSGMSAVNVVFSRSVVITEEEYKEISGKDGIKTSRQTIRDEYGNYNTIYTKSMIEEKTLNIASEGKIEGFYDYHEQNKQIIIGTLEQYMEEDHKFCRGYYSFDSFNCTLADPAYHNDAVKYINGEKDLSILIDLFDMQNKSHAAIAAVKVGSVFFNIMIALISIVNMVNIISTGIINRRSEIAAMECVGMTEGQLYRMAFIEALQYALTAFVSAIILTAILLYGTDAFLASLELHSFNGLANGRYFSHFTIIMRILLASAAALAVSVITSYIPLKHMQKNSLVEQIRSVD